MYKFLLIEDSVDDSEVFKDTIKRLNCQASQDMYLLEVADTYETGMSMISKDLNGIIVDIKLDCGHNGIEIVRKIEEKHRVPDMLPLK